MPFLAEAMRAYEEGLGTAEDIDTGARVGLNHPMGPLELADFIGLDVCLGVMRVLEDGLGREHIRPPRVLEELVAAGHLGQKTGPRLLHLPARAPRNLTGVSPQASPRRAGAAAATAVASGSPCPHTVRPVEPAPPRASTAL